MNPTALKFKKIFLPAALLAAACQLFPVPAVLADDAPSDSSLWDASRPDSHAPIGVMGEHTHGAGEWMLSYRYMYMDMEQNYSGDSTISTAQVLASPLFAVTPTKMNMEMHMSGLMFAPSDNLTLMAMLPWVSKEMEHITAGGVAFTTRSRGTGDLKLGGLLKIHDANQQRVHLNLMFSAPTGSTSEADLIPGPGVVRLPYPMQIGSGTWDLHPGITWLKQFDDISVGAQALGIIRLGSNDEGYTLGDSATGHFWVTRRLADWLSASSRVSVTSWGNIDGADRNLLPLPVPTANPNLRGGTRFDCALGLNYYIRSGPLKGARLAVEAGMPFYQDLDGPQLGTEWTFTTGIQYAF